MRVARAIALRDVDSSSFDCLDPASDLLLSDWLDTGHVTLTNAASRGCVVVLADKLPGAWASLLSSSQEKDP